MNIHLLSIPTEPNPKLQQNFYYFIDGYLPFIIKEKKYYEQSISPNLGYKYQGDFFGLLYELNIPEHVHYLILRLNGMTAADDYDETHLVIKVPTLELITELNAIDL